MISPDLLEILACPACDTRPKVNLENDRLVCVECGRRYPIRDGIPVMLMEEAEPPRPAPPGGRGGGTPPEQPSGSAQQSGPS